MKELINSGAEIVRARKVGYKVKLYFLEQSNTTLRESAKSLSQRQHVSFSEEDVMSSLPPEQTVLVVIQRSDLSLTEV